MSAADTLERLFFDAVTAEEVPTVHEIEKVAFPIEEAASLDAFKARQSVASKLFLGAFLPPRTLVGYVNATLASTPSLTAESMHTHDPNGTSICVHAVAVTLTHRRKRVATALLKEYLRRLQDDPTVGGIRVERVLLICHDDLIPLYLSLGFMLVGKSAVVHGPSEWFEMRKELVPSSSEQPPGAMPSGVLEALANPSRTRPSARLPSAFPSTQALVSPSGHNTFDILCPRPGCSSIVLKAGAATFQTRESVELEPATHPPPAPLQPLPSPPTQVGWWLTGPSPMAFENVAFSRAVGARKLLACAECDLGPFGWSEEGGHEFWLAAARVGYR